MNIAFFGSSLVSSYWDGAATYYRGLLRAIAALGHQITFYEPDAFEPQQHRHMQNPPWARVVVYPATHDGWQSSLAKASKSVDLIAKASRVGVFDKELDIAVPDAATAACIAVYWDVDAPATLEAMGSDVHHHLHAAIPRYDCVFTYGGGPQVVSRYLKLGARECMPLYNALDPQTHYPALALAEYRCDLAFLGSRVPDCEARVAEFFLAAARRLPDRLFLLGGAGWEQDAMPPNVRVIGHVPTKAHNAFLSSGLAILNIKRENMAQYGYSPPTRMFEAAGAAACIITDAWRGIDDFLTPGEEVLVADERLPVGLRTCTYASLGFQLLALQNAGPHRGVPVTAESARGTQWREGRLRACGLNRLWQATADEAEPGTPTHVAFSNSVLR